MAEAALHPEVFFHRALLLRLVAQVPHAVDDLKEGPDAGLHGQLADLRQLLCGVLPPSGAGGHHVQEAGAGGVDGFFCLGVQVPEVADEGRLGHIRDVVGGDDIGQVLLVLGLAGDHGAHRGSRCLGKAGGGGGALDAGVHIRLVVVADVGQVMAALHGPGERLEADVIGAAVAAEGDELDLALDRSLALEGVVGRLHAGHGGAGALKGGVDVTVLIGRVGVEEGADFQAAGGVADHGTVLFLQGPQHAPDGDACAAPGAETVAAHETLFFLQRFFEMIGSFFHDCLPPLAQVGVDRAKLPAVGDVRQAGVDIFEVFRRDVTAAQAVDVAHGAGAVFQVIQCPADLGEERPAVGGKALGLV